jgi:hypothetical protein
VVDVGHASAGIVDVGIRRVAIGGIVREGVGPIIMTFAFTGASEELYFRRAQTLESSISRSGLIRDGEGQSWAGHLSG